MTELAIGLMSGTSLDAVDAALTQIHDDHRVELVSFHTQPLSREDREVILQAIARGTSHELAQMHVKLGNVFADAAAALLDHVHVAARELSFVASHGQTIWHEPGRVSLQLGDPAVVAERLGVRVVSDFRSRDIAAGGQGAPLVPMADVMLFGHPERGRVLLNLGGMANFTWVPRKGEMDGVVACDTGPGVAVIDAVTRLVDPSARYDAGGERALRGQPVTEVVDELLTHPFFSLPPPKSTGRELFGERYAAELVQRVRERAPECTNDDLVATAVALTVRSVAEQLRRWAPPPKEEDLVLSGGGTRHPVVREGLVVSSGRAVRLFDDLFFDGDAKEAVAFAYLGWLTLRGRPGNVPSATGARGSRVLGRITPA